MRTEIYVITTSSTPGCPGAPARAAPRRRVLPDEQPGARSVRRRLFSPREEETVERRTVRRVLLLDEDEDQDEEEEEADEESVEDEESAADEEGVEEEKEAEQGDLTSHLEDPSTFSRRMSAVEMECRSLMASETALPNVTPGRVYSVFGALVDFMSDVRETHVYMIEEPAIRVTGFMRLKGRRLLGGDTELEVSLAGFLPFVPSFRNLSLLVEALNMALLSKRECFAKLASVYIAQPRVEGGLRTGLLPTADSEAADKGKVLSLLRSWGFTANCWGEEVGFVPIDDSADIEMYRGYRKTRLDALRRALDLSNE